ncbi:MAG TPA: oligosaccharide flippase family protein [Acidobacteriaceae bacterium]|nr:oligosaccharide flippase family protein [Acidobacteriaceae bacterium]
MQLRVEHIARSVLSNWFATGATLAVGFFLAPFVVHHLGNVDYGVWVLAISSVNYLTLLDLGMAGSVVRFVSKGWTVQDHSEASEATSAVLWVRMHIAALILLLCGGLAIGFPMFFKVPPDLVRSAREALIIIGVTTASSMICGIFTSTIAALNRYDLRSLVTLVQLGLRVAGVVSVLLAGYGIVAIALCELVAATVANVLLAVIARRIYPELKVRIKKPGREILRKIWSYSFYAFLLTIAGQLIYQSDNLVVGAVVSAVAVTFYSIGNSLCRYTQQLVSSMTITFTPAASTFEAAGRSGSLRSLYFNGTRATLALSLPILVTLLTRGHNFIGVWMGPQYAKISGTVVAILATGLLFSLQNSTASAIAWGVEKHKRVAQWAIFEAVTNLSLSIFLAHKYGLYGVAIGTLIPSVIVNLILWPNYVSRLVDVTYLQVFRRVWGPVFLCAVPFAAASFAVGIYYPAHSIVGFALQTLALLPIFGIAIGLMFRENFKRQVLPRVKAAVVQLRSRLTRKLLADRR